MLANRTGRWAISIRLLKTYTSLFGLFVQKMDAGLKILSYGRGCHCGSDKCTNCIIFFSFDVRIRIAVNSEVNFSHGIRFSKYESQNDKCQIWMLQFKYRCCSKVWSPILWNSVRFAANPMELSEILHQRTIDSCRPSLSSPHADCYSNWLQLIHSNRQRMENFWFDGEILILFHCSIQSGARNLWEIQGALSSPSWHWKSKNFHSHNAAMVADSWRALAISKSISVGVSLSNHECFFEFAGQPKSLKPTEKVPVV